MLLKNSQLQRSNEDPVQCHYKDVHYTLHPFRCRPLGAQIKIVYLMFGIKPSIGGTMIYSVHDATK